MTHANEKLNLLIDLGKYAEAEKVAREAISAEPDWASGYTHLARVLVSSGRPEEAEAAARLGVQKAPADAWAHDILGHVLARQERYKLALPEALEAIRLDPAWAGARRTHAWILSCLERYADTVAAAEAGLRLEPTDWQLMRHKGWALYQLGRFADAEELVKAARRENPNKATFPNILGCVRLAQANQARLRPSLPLYREAGALLAEAVRLEPGESFFRYNLRRAALESRRRVGKFAAECALAACVLALVAVAVLVVNPGQPHPGRLPTPLAVLVPELLILLGLRDAVVARDWLALSFPASRLNLPKPPPTELHLRLGRVVWLAVTLCGCVAAAAAVILAARA